MDVIGLSGQMRNGKDVISDYLANKLNWHRAAFAANVKKVFVDAFSVDYDFIEDWKVKDENPPGFSEKVRKALQKIGDGFREIKEDVWINLTIKNLKGPTIISDIRYINELKKIRELGGINILVYREGYLNNDFNESEAQIRKFIEFYLKENFEGAVDSRFDGVYNLVDYFIFNDGNLLDLYKKIDQNLLPFIEGKLK
jgi:hypothetical protein